MNTELTTPELTASAATKKDRKEPTYLYSEKQVAEKSEIARRFLDHRARQNENVRPSRQLAGEALLQPGPQYLPGWRSAREIQRIDGPGCLLLSALRRLHQLPRDSVLSPGSGPRRTRGSDQRGPGGRRQHRNSAHAPGL